VFQNIRTQNKLELYNLTTFRL